MKIETKKILMHNAIEAFFILGFLSLFSAIWGDGWYIIRLSISGLFLIMLSLIFYQIKENMI